MPERSNTGQRHGDVGDTAERRLVVAADLLSIRAIGPWLEEATDELARVIGDVALAGETRSQFELALQELAVNIVTHGYGDDAPDGSEILLTWNLGTNGSNGANGSNAGHGGDSDTTDTTVTVVVRDTAPPYAPKPERQAQIGQPRVHGYGLLLIEQLVDSFSHDRTDRENVWTLERRF